MKKFLIPLSLAVPAFLHGQSYLDPSFGTGGYVTLDVDGSFDQFKEVAVQPDGKIVVAGHASYAFETNPLVARFTSDGVLDPTFNGTGWALGPDTAWFHPGDYHAMALQPDGKIVCVGSARTVLASPFQVIVARYLTDGTLDPDFGTGGYILHSSPTNNSLYANDVIVTPTNKILICGTAEEDPNNDFEYMVMGLLPDGALDPAFGAGGFMIFHPGDPSHDCEARAMALQSDGRIVVAAEGRVDTTGYVTIWGFRLNTDGTLDVGYGENGLVINYNEGTYAIEVATGPNDEVFLAGCGSIIGSYQDLVCMQLDADGQNAVETVYECASNESLLAQGAWVQDDGKAIALGLNGTDAYILRRLPDGSLDPSFGDGGIVSETSINIEYAGGDHTGGLWLEDNGRMLVCGRSGVVPGNGDGAIIMAFFPGPAGIGATGSSMALSFGPNPASDRVNISVDGALLGEEAVIELFDATGRRVHAETVPALAANVALDLPASLREVLYLVMLRIEEQAPRSARVIVRR